MKKEWLLPPALLGLGTAYLTEELYRYTFCRRKSALMSRLLDKKTHDETYYAARDAATERVRRTPGEQMEIRSARGERLRGRYIPLSGKGRRIAFIVHGYRSFFNETAGFFLDYYASRGFDLFGCDHSAHGDSEGWRIGFDEYEWADCLRWVDELIERFGEDVEIVLHGFSMGGATVLRMSSRCPAQVKLIVDDCGYTSAQELLRPSLGPAYGAMRALHRLIAGVDLGRTDVRPYLLASDKPILFVHGRQDPTVPFAMGEELYELYPGPKDCLFVDGAVHVECMYTAPERYAAKLDEMIGKYVTEPTGDS